MPKKFTKVDGKLVLEKTRRTIERHRDSNDEAERFESYLQEKYGKSFDAPSEGESPLSRLEPINIQEELDILYGVMKDQIFEDLNEEPEEELVELSESFQEYVKEEEVPEVQSVTHPMDRYTSHLRQNPRAIAEQDLQNSPASLADLKNVETSLRNIQTSLTSLGGGGLGANDVISLVQEYAPEVVLDSAHLDYLASKLDSDFKFTDSDEVVSIIHYTVDSAYVTQRVDFEGNVDSAYVAARITIPDAILKDGSDSDRSFALNKGLFFQHNNLSAQDPLTLTYDQNVALKIEKDGSLKINKTTFADSNEVPNVGWVLQNSGDSAETIQLIEEHRDSAWFTSELAKNELNTLYDVDAPAPNQKEFLMWNGAQWVPNKQVAESAFHYKGDIDPTLPNSAPTVNEHGDMWTSSVAGIVDTSWAGLGGAGVDIGDMLVYDSHHVPAEWDNFGHLGGSGGVTQILEGFGIDVNNTTPANPVVSLDTTQVDDRYVNITGSTMTGNLTLDGANITATNGGVIRSNTLRSVGDSNLSLQRNTNTKLLLGTASTIAYQPIKYNAEYTLTDDRELLDKGYGDTNYLTTKGGIITHGPGSPDANHAFRIVFSTSAPADASAIEVDLIKQNTMAFRAEGNSAGSGETHTGYYAHQHSFPEVYSNTSNKLIGFKYEAENGGNSNLVFDANFKTIRGLASGGTLLRSTTDTVQKVLITSDGDTTLAGTLTVAGNTDLGGTLQVTGNLTAPSMTIPTISGNTTVAGNLTVQGGNKLFVHDIDTVNSNLSIRRAGESKMAFYSDATQSNSVLRYSVGVQSNIGSDGRNLIDVDYAENNIAGRTRLVSSLPSTLQRGVIYFTDGNVLSIGV